MASANSHVSNINKQNFNFLLFFKLIVAFAGSIFLAWNDVQAGMIYTLMFVGATALLFLVFFMLKDDNSLKPITNYIKIPFATKTTLAVLFYLVGFAVPIILKLIFKLVGAGFNIVSLSIPLFGADLANAKFQTFSTAEIGTSMPWIVFVIKWVAGTIETYVFNFVFVLLGILVGIFIWQLLADDNQRAGILSKRPFIIFFGFLFSVLGFVASHALNSTYAGVMFFIAGIFLAVSNISIYFFGAFLTFWAGYHESNNNLFLIDVHGLRTVFFEGYVSWYGLFFAVFMLLLIYYTIRKFQSGELQRDLRAWFKS